MNKFTDIHCHIIYGIDDGARDAEEMHKLIDLYVKDGITCAYVTSHLTPGLKQFDFDLYNARLQEARVYIAEQGYDLELKSGAECLYSDAMSQYMRSHELPTLGESAYVLVEFMPNVDKRTLEHAIKRLIEEGYYPIIAHPERYSCMSYFYPGRLKKKYDVILQCNADALLGSRRKLTAHKVNYWVKKGLIGRIATDSHRLPGRVPHMTRAYAHLKTNFGEAVAQKLCGEVDI